jgi:hypothetical protein
LNSWTFCFHLPCSWDYRHAPSCPYQKNNQVFEN